MQVRVSEIHVTVCLAIPSFSTYPRRRQTTQSLVGLVEKMTSESMAPPNLPVAPRKKMGSPSVRC